MATETDTQTPEMGNQTATETVVDTQVQTPDQFKAELAKVQAALKDANAEAAKRRKQLEAYEKAETAKKDAELSETDKLRKQLAEMEAKTKQYERQSAQAAAATKAGLPAAFADRLKGETPEELEADAKSLLEALPKADVKKPAPNLSATNPSGATGGLTQEQRDAQTRAWLNGSAQEQGGGYSLPPKD